MNVLLLSMPDSFEHMPSIAIRMPNGALASLAGNVDPHHHVRVADLILVQDRVRETVERLVRDPAPEVVGLSVMTFQRRTAQQVMRLVRSIRPGVRVVVGGYDPSLAPSAYMDAGQGADFIVRGEGEITFRELLRALEAGGGYEHVAGLSFRGSTWRTWLRLEDEAEAFRRYCALREQEREFLPGISPSSPAGPTVPAVEAAQVARVGS